MKEKILIVVTSCDHIDEHHVTGLWLEEFAIPYIELHAAGYDIVVASPLGGNVPLDPRSTEGEIIDSWKELLPVLKDSVVLKNVDATEFVAIILPGGHGPMFDLAVDDVLRKLLISFVETDKVVGAVCHGPAGLVSAILPDGRSLVYGKKVTGFTNAEERIVQLDKLVPFLLEDKLKELGGDYIGGEPWVDHVVVDGKLVTGQNPQSSASFAKAVIETLQNNK